MTELLSLQAHDIECVDGAFVSTHPILPKVLLTKSLRLITSSTAGYDGSMMNGLQSLPQWNEYFNNPKGGQLGLFNAIQVGILFLSDGRSVLTRIARTLARLVCLS